MPMYWTFNCFFRLLIYLPPLPQVTFKFEFWRPKKNQIAQIGVRGGRGLGDSGNARKKTFFLIDVFPYVSLNNIWLNM